jgi:hypothetical protein
MAEPQVEMSNTEMYRDTLSVLEQELESIQSDQPEEESHVEVQPKAD